MGNFCEFEAQRYLLLLTFKTSSRVKNFISSGRLVNLLLVTWSCFSEVRLPSAEGKVVNLHQPAKLMFMDG